MPSAYLRHTPAHATEQPPLFIYLDYDGVLNSGAHDKLDEMNGFLVGLDHIDYDLRIILLSKRNGHRGRNRTLDELADAGVLDIFDNIVFTSDRTSHDYHGSSAAEHHIYDDAEEETRRGDDGLPYGYHEFV